MCRLINKGAWFAAVLVAGVGVVGGGCGNETPPPSANGGSGGGGGAGGTGPGGSGGGTPVAGNYYPVTVGSWWAYRVTPPPPDPVSYKRVTIDVVEKVGGNGPNADKMGIKHTTCKAATTAEGCTMPLGPTNLLDQTIGWWGVVDGAGGKVNVNYRELAYRRGNLMVPRDDTWWVPYRLRLDETATNMKLNARYMEQFMEVKQPTGAGTASVPQAVSWEVTGTNVTVTVKPPSGPDKTYPNCISVAHSTGSTEGAKVFWYCAGIGKVKETGGQLEELIDHKVNP